MKKLSIENTKLLDFIVNLKKDRPSLIPGSQEAKEWFNEFYKTVQFYCESALDIELGFPTAVYAEIKGGKQVDVEFKDYEVNITKASQ